MKRSNRKRHRPEEVVAKLRQADEALARGTPIAEVARSLGVYEVTLHRWRAEYGAPRIAVSSSSTATMTAPTGPTQS